MRAADVFVVRAVGVFWSLLLFLPNALKTIFHQD